MGDLGSAISGAGSAIGSGLSDATSGLGGFGNALSGFGSALGALGGGGQSAGQAYGPGGVDPNTGQPIPQETPQTAQAQSQGPPTGTTPPGVDPATQIGGTQSRPDSDPNAIFRNILKNAMGGRGPSPAAPTELPGAQPADPIGTTVPTNQGGGAYQQPGAQDPEIAARQAGAAPGQAGGPGANAPNAPYDPTAVSGYGPNAPTSYGPRLTDRNYDPAPATGDLNKQYGDFLQGQGVGRPVAGADVPAAGAQPVSATGGGTGAGGAPGAAQGDGMQNIIGGLMQMFLPMLLGSLMGGGGGGMGALLPMMMMGGMMGQGGLGNMFGGRRMVPGFGGGMLRPGYYPDGRGGFGFHPGGMHGGWRPHYIGAYGAGGGGGVTSAPQRGPWSSSPFLSTLVSAESGGRQGPGVRGDGGMAKGFFQFHDATWRRFARNVPGAEQYDNAEAAPDWLQMKVAMTAPISEWGPRTKQILRQRFGQFDERLTIGQLTQMFGGSGDQGTVAAPANPLAATSPANIRPVSEWQPAGG